MKRSIFVVLAFVFGVPASTLADDHPYQVSPYLLVAGGGDVKINSSSAFYDDITWGANASVGFGARFEVALSEYFTIGGLFEYAALQRTTFFGITPDKDKLMDFDLWVKGGARLELGPGELEVYGGVPFGLTAALVTNVGDDRDALPGYNLGLLGGARYWFDRVAIFTELGYRFHKVIDGSYGDTNIRVSYRISQIAWHLGGSVAF
jgi:hypothetical protein